jgi:2-keto-4-pentenoate hydratase/2-oxohepta-3-ene-1,7-dioic acid hydratase in catechol pathway
MEIVRIENVDGEVCYGCEVGNQVYRLEGDLYGSFKQSDVLLQPVRRLAPIVPTSIFAIGLNYREHAAETGAKLPEYPVVFMKNTSSLQASDAPIILPRHLRSDRVDYEAELAVVLGRDCKNVSVDDALDYVLGYTCANDVSARDWQKDYGGGQWVKGKSFDTFCPLGPVMVTADRIPNPQILPIRSMLNGRICQESYTGDMIFTVAEIISFLSGSTTLKAGTVILTGTPSGVGAAANPPHFLKPGDEIAVEITGIGRLTNSVEEEG